MWDDLGYDFVDIVAKRDGSEVVETCGVVHLWNERYECGIERGMHMS
jgi:hypothetical protein